MSARQTSTSSTSPSASTEELLAKAVSPTYGRGTTLPAEPPPIASTRNNDSLAAYATAMVTTAR